MAYHGLLYVSETCLNSALSDDQVAEIVGASVARNFELEVTGALLFTGRYFAQRLEGPKESIDVLMRSISLDDRHKGIRLADEGPIETREFSGWSMAYSGRSSFVEGHVVAVFNADQKSLRAEAQKLIRLMHEFHLN